ncbi:MAG TPA: hypothetical protein VK835_02850, partial [Bacteroidia bacterium]|nr:hypothetical protein [Bacteroidia bacterium]
MNRQKTFWLKALILFQLISFSGVAGVIRFHQRLQDTVSTTGKDTLTTEVNPKTGSFNDASVSDIITVGIDPSYVKYINDSSAYVITLSINGYSASNTLISTLSHSFKVTHNPTGKGALRDQDLFLFKNAYKYHIKVTGITKNGVAVTSLPDYIYVDADIEVNRFYNFSTYASTPIIVNSPNPINTDCDINNTYDELDISWAGCFGSGSSLVCPESYDLEWTFINDYDLPLGNFKNTSSLNYDFRGNSTRVNTTDGHYRISLIYEHGYIIYRVRGVGVDVTNPSTPIVGVWSLADAASVSSGISSGNYFYVTQSHESDLKNWQYNASFAEEAKKKEVMAYYDGSLRNRQSVTKINSDKNTLVGETFYDFQGRPAINALPAPVDFPTCNDTSEPAIKFYPNFNQDETGNIYSRNDFDIDDPSGACNVTVGGMSTVSGASHYYSPANPNKNAQQAFLPDAKKYPFTQAEYTPDNTGRISRQGSVGINHQLNTGHETKYFYGQPDQLHLNRMFGSEAGDALHYKENVVIDANGQSSLTYMNMEGKTVATSLAGDSVPGLAKLPSNKKPVTLTVDMFHKNANGVSSVNTVNTTGTGIDFNTQLLVPYTSLYNFSYSFTVDTMGDACLRSNICFSCVYDLQIHLYDDCGTDLVAQYFHKPLVKTVGHFSYDVDSNLLFSVNCLYPNNIYSEVDSFSLFLTAGNYSMSKILTVNPQAVNYYTKQYLDSTNNHCFKTLNSFLDSALSNVDTSNCHVTCATCVQKLGDRDAYVAAGKGTYLQYDALHDACMEPCKPKSLCYVSYTQMLADVSPSGQYGQYQDSVAGQADINTSIFPLSVFNDNNVLPRNIGSGNGNWHHPHLIINNSVYNHYADDNGNIATINLHDSAGIYLPKVISSSSPDVLFDATTNTYYTYPENLINFKDFLAQWHPSWANALVYYHPEYDYYQHCSAFGVQQSGETTTSDAFDALMQNTATFAGAVASGLIKQNYFALPYAQRIEDYTQISTTHAYDPFLLHYGAYSAQLASALNNYQPNYTDTSTLTMAEMAAYVVRCGNLFGSNSHAGCIAFGDSSVADSIRNNEWRTFAAFYISLKENLQKRYLDSIVKRGPNLTDYGFNGCFSDSNSTYNGFASLGYQWYSQYQPCGYNTYTYYAAKIPRFGNAPLPNTVNAIQYQNYLATGQCPIANNLQNLLNQFAGAGKIKSAHLQPLRNYPVFAPDLYIALGGDTSKSYQDFYWSSITQGDSLNMNFTDSAGNTTCSLVINLTTSGITNLGKYRIKAVSGLADTTYSSFPNAFRVFLAMQDTTVSPPVILYKKALGYSSCFDINNCKFQEQCQPNDFAIALQNLMNALTINGEVFGTNIDLGQTKYHPFVTPQLKNQLGQTTSDSLIWNFTTTPAGPGGNPPANGVFHLYDNLGNGALQFIIPGNIPNQGNVKGFSHINSNYYNNFAITAMDSIDGDTTLSGYAQTGNAGYKGITQGFSMGTCGYPTSFACQGTQYQLQNDLQLLIHDAVTSIGSNAANDTSTNPLVLTADSFNVDLTKLPSYSTLLATSFPQGLDTTSSVIKYRTAGFGGKYTTQLLFTVKSSLDSCYFSLYADSLYGFRGISDFYSLQAYGPSDPNNNYHEFKGIVKYIVGKKTIVDTLYGKSCLGIQTCCACTTDTIPNPYTYSDTSTVSNNPTPPQNPDPCQAAYNQYIAAIDSFMAHKTAGVAPINFTPLTLQQMVSGDFCSCISNYVAYVNSFASIISLREQRVLENINTFKCYQADTCQLLYNTYVNTLANQGYTGIPYSDILAGGYCGCISDYLVYFKERLAEGGDNKAVSIIGYSCYKADTCLPKYNQYVSTIQNYICNGPCTTAYLDSTGINKNYIQNYTTLYQNILSSNKCDCIGSYIDYIQSLPAFNPISFDTTFVKISANTDTCSMDDYYQYTNALGNYLCNGPCSKNFLNSTGFNSYILPYSNVVAGGFCNCLDPYTTYINSLPPYVFSTINDSIHMIALDGNDTLIIKTEVVQPPILTLPKFNCSVDTVQKDSMVITKTYNSPQFTDILSFNCTFSDTCGMNAYNQYAFTLQSYLCSNRPCRTGFLDITGLSSYILPYGDVVTGGFCNCLNPYINYINSLPPYVFSTVSDTLQTTAPDGNDTLIITPQIVGPGILTLPKFNCPVDSLIKEQTACEVSYKNFVGAIKNYLFNHKVPYNLLTYSFSYLEANNYCSCLDAYAEYLNTFQSAVVFHGKEVTQYPVSINDFNCSPSTDSCSALYTQYTTELNSYCKTHNCGDSAKQIITYLKGITLPFNSVFSDGYCGCLRSYINYVDTITLLHYGSGKQIIGGINYPVSLLQYNCYPTPDTCRIAYEQYLSALHKTLTSYLNTHGEVPLYQIKDIKIKIFEATLSYDSLSSGGYCNCISSYINYLDTFKFVYAPRLENFNSPLSINHFNCTPSAPLDTCQSAYNQYTAALDSILPRYIETHGGLPRTDAGFIIIRKIQAAVDAATLSYDSLSSGGYCGCISNYINYLNTFQIGVSGFGFDATYTGPVSINNFNCSAINLGSVCQQNYTNYLSAVNNYNSVYGPGAPPSKLPFLPAITTLYSENYFTEHGLCYCVPAYDAYLTAITHQSITPNQIDTGMLNIFNYCNANYHPPCKKYVTPDTGNGGGDGFPKDTLPSPPHDYSCAQYQVNLAVENGTNAYHQYYDSLTSIIAAKYTKHCLGAVEKLTDRFKDKEFHYTLYYYDEAGNLIRTVPPEGVHLVNMTASPNTPFNVPTNAADSICYDQTFDTHLFYTSHTMPTTYLYNTLNQLVKQSLPDHDPIDIWQYALPNGLDSRLNITGVQFVNNNAGYLSGYINLPTPILPGINKRGLMYTTSDGGMSWTPMQGLVASN